MVGVTPGVLRLSVPTDSSSLSCHLRRVREFLIDHDVDHEAAHDIRLSVHECCANAIRHSGSPDDIDVSLTIDEGEVTLLVIDSGRGIDLGRCDPRRPPDPQNTCARSLLMAQLR